jgi:predicted RNase H-like HicB family nuclease
MWYGTKKPRYGKPNLHLQIKDRGGKVKTYIFKVELEPDEEGWRAFYPAWEEIGASTWGRTRNEALKNIQEVLAMVIEEFVEDRESIPIADKMTVSEGAAVTVTL